MSTPVPSDRYHALDSLRGFAMLLGVVLHVALSFMAGPPAFWPVRDNSPTELADVFLFAVHDFRMQLFFLLSGFFACLLYRRYGLAGLVKHRLKRVAIPFLLAVLFVVPTVQAVFVYAEVENVRSVAVRGEASPLRAYAEQLIAANPGASTAGIVAGFFTSGAWLPRLLPFHLWFLYYLMFFVAAVAVLHPLVGRLTGTRLLAAVDRTFRRIIEGRGRVLVPALCTFPLMLPMTWMVDTPTGWLPQWHILGYYFAFFSFGWMLFRHRDLVETFGRGWRLNLAVANIVVLPIMFVLIAAGDELGFKAASVLYTWLMIVGLWGAFLRLFSRGSARVRYLADSAYWCYLISLTPVLVLQFVVKDWPLPGELKSVLVTIATLVVLLGSYEWLVRYTFIGAILNGRKHRATPASA